MQTGTENHYESIGLQNTAIVLAAGRGSRMHSDVPKQYLDLCGKPVLAWSLQAFQDFPGVDSVILVTSEEDISYCREEIIDKYRFDKVKRIVPGGAERYLSVWEGLKAAKELIKDTDLAPASRYGSSESSSEELADRSGDWGTDTPIIFIHDGARPLIDQPLLARALACAGEHHACVVGMPVKDTIKIVDEECFAMQTPDRRIVWQAQTPQVFSFPLVYEAYRKLIADGITDVTDDAMVVEKESGVRVRMVEGSYRNLKITTPEDLLSAAQFMMSGAGII